MLLRWNIWKRLNRNSSKQPTTNMSRFIPQLTGAHALVTGGTKGIGRVIVETLLSEGVSVSYCSRNVRGDEFANFKDATDGARAVGTSVDISNAASIQGWVEASAKEFGRIDLVVANGIYLWRIVLVFLLTIL